MAQDLVPYGFSGPEKLPEPASSAHFPGTRLGVCFTVQKEHHQRFLKKLAAWFSNRPEVSLVDTGITDKLQTGFFLLEWVERAVDPLFINILKDEELVLDYTTYTRVQEDI